MRRTLITLAGLALAAPLAAAPATAGGLGPSGSTVEARGLLAPLSVDVMPNGTAWFSQNFTGQLMKKREDGPARLKWSHPNGAEVGAVSAAGPGVTFATTANGGRTTLQLFKDGQAQRLATLSRYEANHNPDARQTYGVTDLDEGCTVPEEFRAYDGVVESHPYATAYDGGDRYVADAAANAIFGVSQHGLVSTVAVLPPQSFEITEDVADANELPDCAVGATANLEGVPTDVETGPDGRLYVTSLPGEQLQGGEGQVLAIDPATGDTEVVAGGLVAPAGLAVAPNGDIYVGQLFAGQISRIPAGSSSVQPWTGANLPGDVEYGDGSIWATRKVLTGLSDDPDDKPRGQLVRYEGGLAVNR